MSQSTPIRFFGALKNLFSRSEPKAAEAQAPEPVVAPPPPPAVRKVVAPPIPRRESAPPAHHSNGKDVVLPLQTIIMAMQPELRSKVRSAVSEDLTISIPMEKILPQLGKGAIKLSFSDVRRAAPQVFAASPEADNLPVTLPLGEILPLINPGALLRKPNQRQVKVSDDIAGPFGNNGQGLVIPTPTPPAPPANKVSDTTTFIRKTPASSRNTTQDPARTSLVRNAAALAVPDLPPFAAPVQESKPIPMAAAPTIPESRPIPMPTARVAPIAPVTPISPIAPAAPVAPVAAAPAAAPIRMAAAPVTEKAAAPAAAPAVAPTVVATLSVNVSEMMEAWPEVVRNEIAKLNLTGATIALPANLVEVGLKRGRVAFKWKSLRSWVQPTPVTEASAHDATELELPLKVVAPLFLKKQKVAATEAQKLKVDETIPNLFFGFPGAQAAPPPVEAAPTEPVAPSALVAPVAEPPVPPVFAPAATAPAPALAPEPVVKPVMPQRPADTNYYVWDDNSDKARVDETDVKRNPAAASGGTDFINRYATPNEIVSRAAALDGVAGVIIALPDGLSVASRIPPDLNGDTLAAFLPQLFSKVSQCTKELRMGELNNLKFTVGNVPWKVFRVNAVYFAAFGRAGEPMPTAQLAALAGELDRKNKQ